MIKKNKRTKNLVFISLLLCYILISLFEPFGIVKAYAGINRSITSDSDRVAIVDNNGNLKFSVKAVGASSGTRWKTVGLYVTSDPTGRNGKESTKAKDCVFFDKLPKGCSKTDHTSSSGLSQLLLPFLPVGSLVTYKPTVFHLVPDDAPTAFTENFKFPLLSTIATLSLSLVILLLMPAYALTIPNGSNNEIKI